MSSHNVSIRGDSCSRITASGIILAQMQPFIDAGVTTYMLDCTGFPDLVSLQLVVDEVLPAFT
jgi:hypothetical protein